MNINREFKILVVPKELNEVNFFLRTYHSQNFRYGHFEISFFFGKN